MSPTKVITPSLRIMQARKREKEKEVFVAERCEDLEGLDEKREEVQERSRRNRQKITKAYGKTTKERVVVEKLLVLKTVDHIRQGMARPSKFSPN